MNLLFVTQDEIQEAEQGTDEEFGTDEELSFGIKNIADDGIRQ